MPSLVRYVLNHSALARYTAAAQRESLQPVTPPLALPSPGETQRRLREWALTLLLMLLTAFTAVRIDQALIPRARQAVPPIVSVIAARPVNSSEQLLVPGQTAPWHTSTLYAQVNGSVARWWVDIGDHVVKGQPLCELETPELDAQLATAQAQLAASQAQALIRQADADFARTTYARWRDSPSGVVSDQERAAKQAAYAGAAARLEAAYAQVAIDRQRLRQLLALDRLKRVRAPLSGVISAREIDLGQNVVAARSGVPGAGSATPTPLYQLLQDDPMRVFVQADQRIAADLTRPGVPARVSVDNTSVYEGQITRTAAAVDPHSGTLRVEIDLPNPQHRLIAGMATTVAFNVAPRGIVVVPAAAIIRRGAIAQVAQLDAEHRIRLCEVSIARNDGEIVELSSGVRPGQLLVASDSAALSEGERVQLRAPTTGQPAALAMALHH